jgi:four helix bundle protein
MDTPTRPAIRSYRDLLAWQLALELAVAVYRLTTRLPATERYGLMDQTRRAAASVPANIAEGTGRRSTKDYLRSLDIANGSLKELETHLVLGVNLGYYTETEARDTTVLAERVAQLLGALIRSLRKRLKTHPTR